MQKVAKFYKVSIQQFTKDWTDTFGKCDNQMQIYECIKLPKRATMGSAGYDFFVPNDFSLAPKQSIKIPTGIRVAINQGWVLNLYPKSGLGFKYRLMLNNTIGIVDSDYFDSSNEGHIFIKIINDGYEQQTINLTAGDAFAQGIFLEFGITEDDEVSEKRDGGFGSTAGKII